jgi:hypothetical protein
MVDADVYHHGTGRLENVDGVKPATQPDLEYGHINGAIAENQLCGQRAELKIGQRNIAARRFDVFERCDQLGIFHRSAVYPYPLVIRQQVR